MNLDISYMSDILSDSQLEYFIKTQLNYNMSVIGFSDAFRKDLIKMLDCLEVVKFRRKYAQELDSVYEKSFHGNLAQQYFKKYIFPTIPNANTILDFGCGSGNLSFNLSKEKLGSHIIGIDIVESEQWNHYRSNCLTYRAFKPEQLANILEEISPDVFISTWVLHHLPLDEQASLFSVLSSLSTKPQLVIIEDAYSDKINPLFWPNIMIPFNEFSPKNKLRVMYAFDWIANVVWSGRYSIHMANTNKTLEQWQDFIERYGFNLRMTNYIGVPPLRDIHNPQCLMVFDWVG